MNSRAARLQPAVDQAKQRSDDTLAQMAAQQNQLAKAEQQLLELSRYRDEYALAGGGAMSISALLNRQVFVERIDRGIVQQAAEIARLKRFCEHGRQRWQQAHARESALGSVIANYREEERQAEDRHEQAEADEHTQLRRSR